jgi:23S rRNA (guanosine2251-2'-O)-methyltransferase
VVYGRNPVRELIRAARRPVHAVWALAQVAEEPWLAGCAVEVRERDALGRAAGSADHQGVVAFTDPYPFADPHDLLDAPGPLVLLDAVQDPRNLGAVARVAEGAGAAGLIVPRRGSPGVTAVACKASAGAVEHLPVAQADNLASLVHDAAGSGRWSAGAVAPGEPDAEDYRTVAWDDAVMLVLGAEGAGLRPRLRAVCDRLVTIPMRGHVASLNLSIAAAILVFEVARTRDSA